MAAAVGDTTTPSTAAEPVSDWSDHITPVSRREGGGDPPSATRQPVPYSACHPARVTGSRKRALAAGPADVQKVGLAGGPESLRTLLGRRTHIMLGEQRARGLRRGLG